MCREHDYDNYLTPIPYHGSENILWFGIDNFLVVRYNIINNKEKLWVKEIWMKRTVQIELLLEIEVETENREDALKQAEDIFRHMNAEQVYSKLQVSDWAVLPDDEE